MNPEIALSGNSDIADVIEQIHSSSANSENLGVELERYDNFIKVKYSDGTKGIINFLKDDTSKLPNSVKNAYGIKKDSSYVLLGMNLSQKKEHQLVNANILEKEISNYISKKENSDARYMITSDVDTNHDMFKDYKKHVINLEQGKKYQQGQKTIYVKDMKAEKMYKIPENIKLPKELTSQKTFYNRAN